MEGVLCLPGGQEGTRAHVIMGETKIPYYYRKIEDSEPNERSLQATRGRPQNAPITHCLYFENFVMRSIPPDYFFGMDGDGIYINNQCADFRQYVPQCVNHRQKSREQNCFGFLRRPRTYGAPTLGT